MQRGAIVHDTAGFFLIRRHVDVPPLRMCVHLGDGVGCLAAAHDAVDDVDHWELPSFESRIITTHSD